MDHDDIYMIAEEQLTDELGREPNTDELSARVQQLMSTMSCDLYEKLVDRYKTLSMDRGE